MLVDDYALADAAWVQALCMEQLYIAGKVLPGRRYACIYPLMFTHAIIVGRIGDERCYEDRWCYASYEGAKAALDAWDGEGEPKGWHRHPDTGRRVDKDGKEYINP